MRVNHRGIILITLAIVFLLAGCGKKEDVKETEKEKEEPKQEEIVDTHEGEAISTITGLYIDEEIAKQRPVAFMMGNTADAAPQSGIGEAAVVYEIPVEGGITRLMAIIENYKELEKIGSSRSCRYYFVHYAMEYGAMYAHFGQSKYALPTLNDALVHNINGLEGVAGKCYYRTSDRKPPHNAYANGQKIYDFAVSKGYPTEYEEGQESHFQFVEEETENLLESGTDARIVRPGYQIDNPWFDYNETDKMYYRSQYGKPHVDKETNQQLSCKNIIIQYVKIGLFDDRKSLIIDTVGSGSGMFVTNGKAISITWKKDTNYGVTKYFDESGNEIKLNRGKTWVLLVDQNKSSKVEIQ